MYLVALCGTFAQHANASSLNAHTHTPYYTTGGGLFGILGGYTNRYGRDPVVLLGMLTHLTTFLLVFYNFPSRAISDQVPAALSFGYLFDPSK